MSKTIGIPQKERMANGDYAVVWNGVGSWRAFPFLAQKSMEEMGATLLSTSTFADMHLWKIAYEDVALHLVYEDFPHGISIEPLDADGAKIIHTLFARLSAV